MIDGGPDRLAYGLSRSGGDYLYNFYAMATPCEVRMETEEPEVARAAGLRVENEARRIEKKFSRYIVDSEIAKINQSCGRKILLDPETGLLLQYASRCFELSEGLFDVTSGVLRRAWHFDGSDKLPDPGLIEEMRQLVGWDKVSWIPPWLVLPDGMEIDLGGIAKEYAVDRCLALAQQEMREPVLVNFGGDLVVSGPRKQQHRWKVAIASVESQDKMAGMLELSMGALATSGDARRFLIRDGVRYGHILDPRTGWPVKRAPRSVTVAAATCVEAGMTATLAVLQGVGAEKFLRREGVLAWCIR